MNLRPSGYEPDELPGCSTARQVEGQHTSMAQRVKQVRDRREAMASERGERRRGGPGAAPERLDGPWLADDHQAVGGAEGAGVAR